MVGYSTYYYALLLQLFTYFTTDEEGKVMSKRTDKDWNWHHRFFTVETISGGEYDLTWPFWGIVLVLLWAVFS